jgi:hypothetical protein
LILWFALQHDTSAGKGIGNAAVGIAFTERIACTVRIFSPEAERCIGLGPGADLKDGT